MVAQSASVAKAPPALFTEAASLDDYVLEEHIGFLLRRAFQRHAALFADGFSTSGLTPTQFAALVKVVQLQRVTQNLLGRLTAMDPATIQGVVRRLIERGLIRREDDPLDRRSAVLVPTDAAFALIEETLPTIDAVQNAVLHSLSAAEQRELKRLLARIG